ncbi:ATP-dependent nuclease [Aeromicrobium erythreum]|uniref:Uncharacterized protein n=1 Tax=Aeromicrobium erythreum TaxID=2041 RepID=A0A0U4BCG5_9ACTN|nr:ATP-dependent endonuclease [Aeromicrobium erythreum]ALX05561.1 hypothetical protein AERYTH_13060 [Aeromicrobium erythreum]
MRIESVTIKAFRCLEDVTVEFDDVTTLVGPNGAGKSTVLRALDWFFNGASAAAIGIEDWSHGREDQTLSVRVTFSDIQDADRAVLGRYAPEAAARFTAWKERRPDGVEKMSANLKAYPPFDRIRLIANKLQQRSAFNELAGGLGLERASNAQQVNDRMRVWESEHLDQLEDAAEELQTNFFGFNGASKMAGIFDFVLITADLRAADEVHDARGTILGRILERKLDRTVADEELEALAIETAAKQDEIYQRHFETDLEDISARLTNAVGQFSSGHEVRVERTAFDSPSVRARFSVAISEQDLVTTVDRQGHGFQRTLLISALKMLAEFGSDFTDKGVICLAIEEPELFQHPSQAMAFASVLRKLAEDPGQGVQVSYATHSPHFIKAGRFYQVRRLTRPVDPETRALRGTRVSATSVDDVVARLDGLVGRDMVERQLDSIATYRLPDALFANAVVLVEGATDRAVLQGVGDRVGEVPLSTDGVVIAEVGGKDSILIPLAVLQALEIPAYVMFDGDGDLEERMLKHGRSDDDRAIAVDRNRQTNERLLSYLGEDERQFSGDDLVRESCAVFGSTLEGVLQTWPEWLMEVERMQDEGVATKKNNVAYRFATATCGGEVPDILQEIIERVRRHTL